MNPPKFKVGDMVMYSANNDSNWRSHPEKNGAIMTVIARPFVRWGYWAYPTDGTPVEPGARVCPIEPRLVLIKPGDLPLPSEEKEKEHA